METTRDPEAARERRRAEIVAETPARYSPTVHLAVPSLVGLSVFVASLLRIEALRPVELLAIPVTWIAALGFEWRVHKDILHHRMPLLGLLYERHELAHHVIYTDRDMTMRSRREFWLVLMPPYAIVLVFLFLVLPLAIGLTYVLGTNVAMLVTATSMAFFLSYEWLHLAYHLPVDHPVAKVGVIARLREHHLRHHEPRLMKRWNFNVTVPLFDWIHRSTWTPEREAERQTGRARRRAGRLDRAPS